MPIVTPQRKPGAARSKGPLAARHCTCARTALHVHENHDSGSGAQCLPLAGTEPFFASNLEPTPFLSMCPGDSPALAALAALVSRPHLALVCMCAGAFCRFLERACATSSSSWTTIFGAIVSFIVVRAECRAAVAHPPPPGRAARSRL